MHTIDLELKTVEVSGIFILSLKSEFCWQWKKLVPFNPPPPNHNHHLTHPHMHQYPFLLCRQLTGTSPHHVMFGSPMDGTPTIGGHRQWLMRLLTAMIHSWRFSWRTQELSLSITSQHPQTPMLKLQLELWAVHDTTLCTLQWNCSSFFCSTDETSTWLSMAILCTRWLTYW